MLFVCDLARGTAARARRGEMSDVNEGCSLMTKMRMMSVQLM